MYLPGMSVEDLDTPVQVVDLDKLDVNIRAMQAAVDTTGARLRPHIKTHKIPEIARLQAAAGAHGIADVGRRRRVLDDQPRPGRRRRL